MQESTNQGKLFHQTHSTVLDLLLQCDETKPICQRCIKAHRECLKSNIQQGSISIHSENRYASGKTKRPRGPRVAMSVATRPVYDLHDKALIHFLHYQLQGLTDVPDISQGMYDLLPGWVSRTNSSMVDLAVSSMALAVFSQTQHCPAAAAEASTKYQQLLRIAQMAIPALVGSNIDVCLVAIFLMGRFEGSLLHRKSLNPGTSIITSLEGSYLHHDGAMAVLKIWKNNEVGHRLPPTDIVKYTRRGLIKSTLLRHLAVPQWMADGGYFGEDGLELDYDRMIVQVTNLCHQSSMFLAQKSNQPNTSPGSPRITQKLIDEARDLDQALQDWAARFPSTWSYQRHVASDVHRLPTRGFYSSTVYSFSTPGYASAWLQYFATRMLIISTRFRLLALVQDEIARKQQQNECASQIKVIADDLASSLPFCLERFRVTDQFSPSPGQNSIIVNTNDEIRPNVARLVGWPLTVASNVDCLDVKQKSWFQAELASAGRVVGAGVFQLLRTDVGIRF